MPCFADNASAVVTQIVEHTEIAQHTMRLRVCVPEMARVVTPGQFFMLRNPGGNDPLIGRAFALFDVADAERALPETDSPHTGWIDVVYVVKGKLTSSLKRLSAGDEVALWGPLGNGFPPLPTEHLILVAGGIGQTPFVALTKEALGRQNFGRSQRYAQRVSLCYGARSASYLAGIPEFEAAGAEVLLATEDGSAGMHGRVTELLERLLLEDSSAERRIACCGPEPMMEAVAKIAHAHGIDCLVSLETPMACGIGICFTCVAKVGSASDWDYKRTCVEGPVFNAGEILWH